jgi:hypothetical protein
MTPEIDTGRLERFRTLRRWSVALSLVPLPIWGAVALWIHLTRPSPHLADSVAYTVLDAWLVLFTAAVLWMLFVRCPRCDKRFFSALELAFGFTLARCSHCGFNCRKRKRRWWRRTPDASV